MRISELIAKLQEAMAEHGDLSAYVLATDDYGTIRPQEAQMAEVVYKGRHREAGVLIARNGILYDRD